MTPERWNPVVFAVVAVRTAPRIGRGLRIREPAIVVSDVDATVELSSRQARVANLRRGVNGGALTGREEFALGERSPGGSKCRLPEWA